MFHAISALRFSLAVSLLLVTVPSTPAHAAAQKGPEARLLERALKLLPEPPAVPVRMIDPDLTADPDALRRLDAFLVREANGKIRQVIYLNRRAAIVENALAARMWTSPSWRRSSGTSRSICAAPSSDRRGGPSATSSGADLRSATCPSTRGCLSRGPQKGRPASRRAMTVTERVPVRDGQASTLFVKEMLLRRHAAVASGTGAAFVESAMNWNVLSPLRALAATLLLCLAAPDAQAQSPLDPCRRRPPVSGVGVPSGPAPG